jgi:hypothetical protein
MNKGLAILATIAAGIILLQSLYVPSPSDPYRRPTSNTNDTRSLFTEFDVPASQGLRVKARFYRLDQLPSGDEATLCAGFRASLAKARDQKGLNEEWRDTMAIKAATSVDAICTGNLPRLKGVAFARLLQDALIQLLMMDHTDVRTSEMQAAVARGIVDWLREAKNREEVDQALLLRSAVKGTDIDQSGLALMRFSTDLNRLSTELCGKENIVYCKGIELARAGKSYAELGRLSNDEQHFRDMAETLASAEAYVRQISERELRLSVLEDIVAAYGLGGEAGRDGTLLRRAVEIAETIVSELKPAHDEEGSEAYGEALETLAASLGRYAGRAPNRIVVTRRAIEVGEIAIAHQAKRFPDSPSWTSHINLATEQRDLFELTLDPEWIEKAAVNARRALAIKSASVVYGGPDAHLFYARMRLGQILAWKAKHGANLADAQRRDLSAEAKMHLESAEAVFQTLNTQAYLRIIARTRPLLPHTDEAPR